jgi:hypothetical protein
MSNSPEKPEVSLGSFFSSIRKKTAPGNSEVIRGFRGSNEPKHEMGIWIDSWFIFRYWTDNDR